MVATVEGELVTSGQAARLVGRPVKAMCYWVAAGHLEPVETYPRRLYRVADVLAAAAKVAALTAGRQAPAECDPDTDAELGAAVAARLADLPHWWRDDAARNGVRSPRQGRQEPCPGRMVTPRPEDLELHESTAPDAIAARHAAEVGAFFAAHPDATVEEASAELVLCPWIVERHSGRKRAPVPGEAGRGVRTAEQKDKLYRALRTKRGAAK